MTQALNGAKRQAGHAGKTAQNASPVGGLQSALQQLAGTVTDRAVSSMSGRMGNATDRLSDYAENGGGKGLLEAVTGLEDVSSPVKSIVKKGVGNVGDKVKDAASSLFGGKGKGKGGKKIKVTNIVEHIDVGTPIDLTYRQWTQFAEWPKYMKKLEQVEQVSDEKLRWKAQIFLSHRSWESTITEQVPNERIVWRSKGDKGYIDGAITFHELAPNLTRVVVVLEYHPQGLFEKTGNLWRAQGRRVRLELKHFQRQLMTDALLHPDDVEGWEGEIRDGEVVDEPSDETDDDTEDTDDDTEETDDDTDDEDTSSSNGKQRRTAGRRRTADRSDSGRATSGAASRRKSSGTASPRKSSGSPSPRKSSAKASPRKSTATSSSRKSSGDASRSKSGGAASTRKAGASSRTASARGSSSRTASSRRRVATKSGGRS